MRKILFSALVIVLSAQAVNGQTLTVSEGNWSDGGNWSSGVPTDGSTATINDSMTLDVSLTISTGGTYTFNDDLIDPPGGGDFFIQQKNDSHADINANVTVGGTYSVKNTSTLIIRSGDTLRVGGDFSSGQNTFMEIEPGGVLYVEGDMTMNNSTAYLINGNIYVEGDFESNNSASMSGAGNIEVDGNMDLNNSSNIFGNTGDCNPGPCEYGSGAGLPIALVNFKAEKFENDHLKVDWTTASEVNNEFFKIEISADGYEYKLLAEISGAGNSQTKIDYSIVRMNPFYGNPGVYLRLTQYDYDGQNKQFNPIYVSDGASFNRIGLHEESLTIYPNPNSGQQIGVATKSFNAGNYKVQIIDISGRVMEEQNFMITDPNTEYKLEIRPNSQLKAGFYLMRISGDQFELSERFSVQP